MKKQKNIFRFCEIKEKIQKKNYAKNNRTFFISL